MRLPLSGAVLLALLAPGLLACGGGDPGPIRQEEAWKGHGPLDILRKYAGPDGRLTRQQLDAGLRKDFEAADKNHDGVLQPDEARAVNQQRWSEDQSAISPLQDWNGDGVIDFNEFAATARALFGELDRDGNGVLTPDELHPGGAAGADGKKPEEGGQGEEGGRGNRRGGHPGG